MKNEIKEFDINEFINNVLSPLDIPVYFAARKANSLPVAIFNVTSEKSFEYWDDGESVVIYKIIINIFSRGNYVTYKNQIKNLMREAGCKRLDISACIYQEDVEIFNQPMTFQYIREIF